MLPTLKKPGFNRSSKSLLKTGSHALLVFVLSGSITPLYAFDRQAIYHADRSPSANSRAFLGMSDDEVDRFALGRSFFNVPWVEPPSATTARDGLGPLFNANACASCHRNNGGGAGIARDGAVDRSIAVKLSRGGSPRQPFRVDPVYGNQVAINGNLDVPFEAEVRVRREARSVAYRDGGAVVLNMPRFSLSNLNYGPLAADTTLNPVKAPVLIGLGLIESIPEAQIVAHEDAEDRDGDGISGRANRVWSWQHNALRLGRYGWKAATPSVVEQTAHALNDDMGLTTHWFRKENCGPQQARCLEAYQSSELDVPEQRLEAIAFYLSHLRVPRSTRAENLPGKKLFSSLGCKSCHRTGYRNDDGVEVAPYSDFLLHDMGPELAAQTPMFEAEASEWRTAPLWGLGLHKVLNPQAGFLHDGRALTLEEAVMWHGGEASASRDAFASLDASARAKLIAFLEAL
jgi:CxxC motif-containing protein (DUF1111 family)